MRNAKPIRDPIYDYISVSELETGIVDTPDFQRLRYVLQNSTAYLTYPNANNCRFLHSLGTMHLSGRIFVHALKNASTEDLIHFISILDKIAKVGEFGNKNQLLHEQWNESLGNACRFLHNPMEGSKIKFDKKDNECFLVSNESGDNTKILSHDPLFLINCFWQAIRVVGLVHDIGHLPMSHLFENAIARFDDKFSEINSEFSNEISQRTESYVEKLEHTEADEFVGGTLPPVHELRGLFIYGKLDPSSTPNDSKELFALIFDLARKILLHKPDAYFNEKDTTCVLRALHRIVAGEIDADRLDYCVRDAKASGLEFGAIDVERIVSNMVLCRDQEGQFFFIPSQKALSAVESFFHQRYLLYKYEIYHHNVVRFDGLLEEILVWMLEQAFSGNYVSSELLDLFDKVSFVKLKAYPGDPYRFMPDKKHSAIYEDSWLRSVLSEIYILLDNSEDIERNETETIRLMLETFLYRKTDNILSFWKRDSDVSRLLSDPDKINKLSPFTLNSPKSATLKRNYFQNFISDLEDKLGQDFKVIVKKLKPKIHKIGDLSSSIHTNTGISLIEDISRYVESLNYSIRDVPDVHVSVLCKNIKNDLSKLKFAQQKFKDALYEYMLDLESDKDINN